MPTASYPYAYGCIRSLETSLINSAKLERMMAASNADDMLRALMEEVTLQK